MKVNALPVAPKGF